MYFNDLHLIEMYVEYHPKRLQWREGSCVSYHAPVLRRERGSSHWSHSILVEKHYRSSPENEADLTTFATPPH